MDTLLILAIVAVVFLLLVVAAAAWLASSRKRTSELRRGFGPEYDRAVRKGGSRRQAEAELDARRKRVEKLHLKEISPVRAHEYAERVGTSRDEARPPRESQVTPLTTPAFDTKRGRDASNDELPQPVRGAARSWPEIAWALR